jgi:hypothetical protein
MSMPVPKQNPANSTFSRDIGGTPKHYISVGSTNLTSVKANPGTLMNCSCMNPTASMGWLKLYDTASAPVIGVDDVVQCWGVPASTSGNGFTISVPIDFQNGIAFAFTGLSADADATNSPAGVALNFIYRD